MLITEAGDEGGVEGAEGLLHVRAVSRLVEGVSRSASLLTCSMMPSRTPEVRTAAAVRPTAVPSTPDRARTWARTQARTDHT